MDDLTAEEKDFLESLDPEERDALIEELIGERPKKKAKKEKKEDQKQRKEDKKGKKKSRKGKKKSEKRERSGDVTQTVDVNVDGGGDQMDEGQPNFLGAFGGAAPTQIDTSIAEPSFAAPFVPVLQEGIQSLAPQGDSFGAQLGQTFAYAISSAIPSLIYAKEAREARKSSAEAEQAQQREQELEKAKQSTTIVKGKEKLSSKEKPSKGSQEKTGSMAKVISKGPLAGISISPEYMSPNVVPILQQSRKRFRPPQELPKEPSERINYIPDVLKGPKATFQPPVQGPATFVPPTTADLIKNRGTGSKGMFVQPAKNVPFTPAQAALMNTQGNIQNFIGKFQGPAKVKGYKALRDRDVTPSAKAIKDATKNLSGDLKPLPPKAVIGLSQQEFARNKIAQLNYNLEAAKTASPFSKAMLENLNKARQINVDTLLQQMNSSFQNSDKNYKTPVRSKSRTLLTPSPSNPAFWSSGSPMELTPTASNRVGSIRSSEKRRKLLSSIKRLIQRDSPIPQSTPNYQLKPSSSWTPKTLQFNYNELLNAASMGKITEQQLLSSGKSYGGAFAEAMKRATPELNALVQSNASSPLYNKARRAFNRAVDFVKGRNYKTRSNVAAGVVSPLKYKLSGSPVTPAKAGTYTRFK